MPKKVNVINYERKIKSSFMIYAYFACTLVPEDNKNSDESR